MCALLLIRALQTPTFARVGCQPGDSCPKTCTVIDRTLAPAPLNHCNALDKCSAAAAASSSPSPSLSPSVFLLANRADFLKLAAERLIISFRHSEMFPCHALILTVRRLLLLPQTMTRSHSEIIRYLSHQGQQSPSKQRRTPSARAVGGQTSLLQQQVTNDAQGSRAVRLGHCGGCLSRRYST